MFSKIPRQKPDYRLETLDGEMLLYHSGDTKIIYCNQTASLVWQLCDGQRSVERITTLLRNAYPEADDTIADDVTATLSQFAEQGVIEFK